MISSVSAVSFRGTAQNTDPISRVGAYTKMPEMANQPKKKGGFFKALLKLIGLAALITAGLIVAKNKEWVKSLKVEELKDAKFMPKVGHYVAEAGKWCDTKLWQPICGIFNRVKPEVKQSQEIVA